MSLRVKICGITNVLDALAAVDAGANALGFVFYKRSPRFVTGQSARAIIGALPPLVAKVGVFVNAPEALVRRMIQQCGLDTLQFHGDETPQFCRAFGLKTIKAFRIRDQQSLARLADYTEEAWLLDSDVPGKLGGTGARFNWELAGEAKKMKRTIILAGGLTPENVAEAIRQVHPYAVDVSSGVESAPGKKDPVKMRNFIRIARAEAPD
ncbi:MAG: phosphoribosylanthranilate isomerase [Chloroflexi bacterium]|nr:phosphoribosylanthranilate isomerase [Chloroflexota bacterium]